MNIAASNTANAAGAISIHRMTFLRQLHCRIEGVRSNSHDRVTGSRISRVTTAVLIRVSLHQAQVQQHRDHCFKKYESLTTTHKSTFMRLWQIRNQRVVPQMSVDIGNVFDQTQQLGVLAQPHTL